jgi:hypothetical protein
MGSVVYFAYYARIGAVTGNNLIRRGSNDVGRQLRLGDAHKARAPKPAHRFHPAEDLLDSFALSLTQRITAMACGARNRSWQRRARTTSARRRIIMATLPQSPATQPPGGPRSVRILTAWSAPPAGVLKIIEER